MSESVRSVSEAQAAVELPSDGELVEVEEGELDQRAAARNETP